MNRSELIHMKLHESREINNGEYIVTRVLGGWIYCRQEPQANIANPVFVPFSIKL